MTGAGGAAVVLIPGAGGAAWYWHLVAADLRGRGFYVVAVDLPADDEAAGLPEYVRTVLTALGPVPESGVALVAQSLGGFTAALVCEEIPVRSLVFLNAMIPQPGETAGQWWEATAQSEAMRSNDIAAGRDPDADFDLDLYFLHDVPQSVIDSGADEQRPQSGTVFESSCEFSRMAAVPTTVLVGRDDRFFPAEFQRRIAHERLGLTAQVVPGGHLAALSYPAEVADAIVQAVLNPPPSRKVS